MLQIPGLLAFIHDGGRLYCEKPYPFQVAFGHAVVFIIAVEGKLGPLITYIHVGS